MTRKMTTKNEHKNEQENDQKNGQENGSRSQPAKAAGNGAPLRTRTRVNRRSDQDRRPQRTKGVEGPLSESASLGAVACPPRRAANLRFRD